MRDKGCGRQRFAASFLNILKILLDRCRVPLKKYTAPVKKVHGTGEGGGKSNKEEERISLWKK